MRQLRTVAFWALVTAVLSTSSSAQSSDGGSAHARLLLFPTTPTVWQDAETPALAPPFVSLALPGMGQHMLGQQRKWIYGAIEVIGWVAFLERRGKGAEYRDQYRDFAWTQGRLQSGPRIDGDFDYYETLSKWNSSGDFDADSGLPGVQPEMDAATFNGSIWSLASQIFIAGGGPVTETDPAFQGALGYYMERAYGAAFLWDWSTVPGGREELGGLIETSDDRFRQATTALGVVIANHLVSAVDAYLSGRGTGLPARLSIMPNPQAFGPTWNAQLTLPVGR
jgi:hypothetical protein